MTAQAKKLPRPTDEEIEAAAELIAACREFRDLDEKKEGDAPLWWRALSRVTAMTNCLDVAQGKRKPPAGR